MNCSDSDRICRFGIEGICFPDLWIVASGVRALFSELGFWGVQFGV